MVRDGEETILRGAVRWRDPPGVGHGRVAATAEEVLQDGQMPHAGGDEHGRIACTHKEARAVCLDQSIAINRRTNGTEWIESLARRTHLRR